MKSRKIFAVILVIVVVGLTSVTSISASENASAATSGRAGDPVPIHVTTKILGQEIRQGIEAHLGKAHGTFIDDDSRPPISPPEPPPGSPDLIVPSVHHP